MTGMATGIWRSRCASCVAGFLILWPCSNTKSFCCICMAITSTVSFSSAQQARMTHGAMQGRPVWLCALTWPPAARDNVRPRRGGEAHLVQDDDIPERRAAAAGLRAAGASAGQAVGVMQHHAVGTQQHTAPMQHAVQRALPAGLPLLFSINA